MLMLLAAPVAASGACGDKPAAQPPLGINPKRATGEGTSCASGAVASSKGAKGGSGEGTVAVWPLSPLPSRAEQGAADSEATLDTQAQLPVFTEPPPVLGAGPCARR